MKPILITYVGGQCWTVAESERRVDYKIRHGQSIAVAQQRPIKGALFDGMPAKFNYANVIACVAFPA